MQFFGLALSASMPIACGLYAPSLIIGTPVIIIFKIKN